MADFKMPRIMEIGFEFTRNGFANIIPSVQRSVDTNRQTQISSLNPSFFSSSQADISPGSQLRQQTRRLRAHTNSKILYN